MSQTPEQLNNFESTEKIKRRCLLIDDHPAIVEALNEMFSDADFLAVKCQSVEEALQAIKKYSPKIIFLDHSLTPGGGEGLEIARLVKEMFPEITIYSSTTNYSVQGLYKKMGIAHIDKNDGKGLRAVIDNS